jgi:hypothetical protein
MPAAVPDWILALSTLITSISTLVWAIRRKP